MPPGATKKMQAVKASRPYWQYLAVMDRRVRPSHAILDGKVYPADHEFWATHYPPNGFRCRCDCTQPSARQVEKQGLTVESHAPGRGWTDPKTGMECFVHFPGPDKGFRNNPGKDWAESGLNLKNYPDVNRKKLRGTARPGNKTARAGQDVCRPWRRHQGALRAICHKNNGIKRS